MVGSGGATVSDTGIVRTLEAVGEEIETEPEYVCTAKPAVLIVTITLPGVAPESGLTVNQLAEEDAVKVSGLVLATGIDCAAGTVPPFVHANERAPVLVDKTAAGVTTRLTGIFTGSTPLVVDESVKVPLYVCAVSP